MNMVDAPCDEHLFSMSDKKFTDRLQAICDVLNTSGRGVGRWEDRLQALRQLGFLAKADISRRPEFVRFMNSSVKVPLQRHIEDDRAALSCEACHVVASLADCSSNRSAWKAVSEWFIPSLLRVTARKKKVFVDAAVDALCTLARTNSFGRRAFSELLRGCTAAHAATRRHTFSVLQLFIQQCKNNEGEFTLSPYLNDMCKVLRAGLADADAQTRMNARNCYRNFRSAEAGAAETLYSGLDAPVRRALGRCQSNVAAERPGSGSLRVPAVETADDGGATCEGLKDPDTQTEGPCVAVSAPQVRCPDAPHRGETNMRPCHEAKVDAPLASLSSSSWEERLQCVRRIADEFHHFRQKEECARLLVVRLNDPNVHVVQAALEVLPLVFRLAPSVFRGLLPELITSLLINVNDRKVFSSESRRRLVDIIRVSCINDVMNAIYYELRRIVSPCLKVHALEYAKQLYVDNAVHFTQLTPMRNAVEELLSILHRDGTNEAVVKSATSALTALYVTAKNTFLRVLLYHLSPDDRQCVVNALQLAVPHLGEECRQALAGQKLLRHPVPVARCAFTGTLKNDSRPLVRDGCANELPVPVASGSGNITRAPIGKFLLSCTKSCRSRPAEEEGNGRPAGRCRSADAVLPDRRPFRKGRVLTASNSPPPCVEAAVRPHSKAVLCGSPRFGGWNNYDATDLLDWLETVSTTVEKRDILDVIAGAIARNPSSWAEVFNRLLAQLENLVPDSHEPNHTIRSLGLRVLHIAVGSGALRHPVNRSLKRIFLLVRMGIDDVFPEVQMDSTALLDLILNCGLYSADHLLNAVAMSLDTWLLSNQVGHSSRGWLTMLETVKHLISQLGSSAVLVPCAFKEYAELKDAMPGVVSEPVLRRVCDGMVCALQHSVPEVRLAAVVVCVAIWMSFDSAALPYFVGLTASQRKLISMYFEKTTGEAGKFFEEGKTRRDMTREMRAAGLSCVG